MATEIGLVGSSLTLRDIKPIKPEDVVSNFKGIWQFKSGLLNWSGFSVFWLACALLLAVVCVGFDRPGWPVFGLRVAGSASVIVVLGLVWYLLSNRGLARLFCPAQRALKETAWLNVRAKILRFNRDLAKAQDNDQFLRSYERVPYAQVVARLIELRNELLQEVEVVTKAFTRSCGAWCATQNWRKALRVLGPVATRIDTTNRLAEVNHAYDEMAEEALKK